MTFEARIPFLASAVAAFGFLGVPLSAQAVQITFGPTADGIFLSSQGGGLVGAAIAPSITGSTLEFGGIYTLDRTGFSAAPNGAGQYTVTSTATSIFFFGGGGCFRERTGLSNYPCCHTALCPSSLQESC